MTQRPQSRYWIIHDGQIICDVSDPVLTLFRCTRLEILGRDIFEIIPSPEMAALARLRMNHIREKGELHNQDLPVQRPDGSTFWVTVITHKAGEGVYISELTYKGEHNPHYHDT